MAINWVPSTQVFVNSYGPSDPIVLFASTVDPQYQYIPSTFKWGLWNTVDLTVYGVSPNAVWADIGGIFIVTGAGELEMLVRGIGSSDSSANYDQQDLSWSSNGGDRSVSYETVPLSNGQFQVLAQAYPYPRTNPPFQVGGSSGVAFNLKLKKWGM